MALKKKDGKSKKELYMLDVFIDRLNLSPDKSSDVNTENLVVCVKFIDLPEYEINPSKNKKRDSDKENREAAKNAIDLKSGKSYLFAKTSNSLVKSMKSMPLCAEVYSGEKNERSLLCTAKTQVPTCMCSQIIPAKNNENDLPEPAIAKETLELTDSEGKIWGTISIMLRLSYFGSSPVSHFSLNEKSFALENSVFDEKFPSPNGSTEKANGQRKTKEESARRKPLITRPNSPPRVSLKDPGFKHLTTAEKLNDPKFRQLVYRAYPDEPTCRCKPTDRSTHPMMCPSGCGRSCCMKLRNPDVLAADNERPKPDTLQDTYCINRLQSGASPFRIRGCDGPRLRGGGDIEQLYIGPSTAYKWADYDTDCTWYEDKFNMENRLEGGGGGEKEKSSCSCSGGAVPVPFRESARDPVIAIEDACKPRANTHAPRSSCVCPGKETAMWTRGAAKCSKNPCMGVDCLIRAFQEAQDFVDSLGQVPGLAGLGLMDPSESPYFGRDIDKDYVVKETPTERRRPQLIHQQGRERQCNAACSVTARESSHNAYAMPRPLPPPPLVIPGRTGVVREAVPMLPRTASVLSARYKRKDERRDEGRHLNVTLSVPLDVDLGPCGEPKCKSKQKNQGERQNSYTSQENHELSQKKSDIRREPKSSRYGKMSRGRIRKKGGADRGDFYRRFTEKGYGKRQKSQAYKPSIFFGGRDRSPSTKSPRQHPEVKISRRVWQYVYHAGDAYPGLAFGHRDCIDIPMRVPANMGWLWNTTAIAGKLKPRIGWRPGAIARFVYDMLKEAKEDALLDDDDLIVQTREAAQGRSRSAPSRGRRDMGRRDVGRKDTIRRDFGRNVSRRDMSRRGRAFKTSAFAGGKKMQSKMEGIDEGGDAPPTLHIHRKDGTYYVTMYPIKPETKDEPGLTEPMKPLQFKIVKNKDDGSVASSSTASDMEIEFSPPAAVSRYHKKPDVIHVDTQVRQQEILDAYKVPDSQKKRDRKLRKEKKLGKK